MPKSTVDLWTRVIAIKRKHGENAYPYAAVKQLEAAVHGDVDAANMWSEVLDKLDCIESGRIA